MASIVLTHQVQVHWGTVRHLPKPLKISQLISGHSSVLTVISWVKISCFSGDFLLKTTHPSTCYPHHPPLSFSGSGPIQQQRFFCWFHHWCKGKPYLQQWLISTLEHRFLCKPEPSSFIRYFQSTLEIPLILPCSEIKSMMSFPGYLKSILAKRVRVSLPQHV